MAADYIIEPLTPRHNRASFSCGAPSLDDYIHKQAGQDVKRDLAACYVLCVSGSPEIVGYYTLNATSLDLSSLPQELAKKAGRYPLVPAVLLGRLAVDVKFAGQGIGTLLLLNAMRRVLRTGIGIKAIVVDALDESAVRFYERFEFRRFADDSMRLYLPMNKVRDIFPGEGIEREAP